MTFTERTTTFERDNVQLKFVLSRSPEYPDTQPQLEIHASYADDRVPTSYLWLASVADLTALRDAIVSYMEMTGKGEGE